MKKWIVAALALTLVTVACSAAWLSTFNTIVAVAVPGLANVLQIIAVSQGQPVNSGLAAKIAADGADLTKLATDFARASSAAAPTACSQFQAAAGVFQTDQQQVLQLAQVSSTRNTTRVELIAGLIITTVEGVLAAVPACAIAGTQAFNQQLTRNVEGYLGGGGFGQGTYGKAVSGKDLAAKINALVPDKYARYRVATHSKVVRVLTLGKVK